jgi:hypothetical protein
MSKKRPRQKREDTISAYEPGMWEGLFDATLAAPIRGIAGLLGMPERDAYQYSQRAVRAADDVTGLVSAEKSLKNIENGRGGARDYLQVAAPVIPFAVGRGLKAAGRAAERAVASSPVVNNRMYSEKLLGPEYKAGQDLPAYGFRNVNNPIEIDDIISSGYMRPKKSGGSKYFTMSDNPKGNPANLEAGKPVIRVDSANIPYNSPVRAEHVMVWDEATQSFIPILKRRGN